MFFGKCFFLGEFFFIPAAMGGGVPPIPLIFVVVKSRPKNSVFGQIKLFLAKNFSNSVRYRGGRCLFFLPMRCFNDAMFSNF